jgi:signal transduction histidine kinase/ActR/RegA family two-component response regulator
VNEKPTYEELEQRLKQLEKENSEFKRLEDSLKNRIVALTLPLNDNGNIAFEELFNIDDIQRIQDEFAKVTGVASIITHTDGTPITAPSKFCRLCKDIIRKTDKGLANCFKSDSLIGRLHPGGPIIQPCMSGGLWDAGAGITVGGRHIANWLIGQVRDELQTEDNMLEYAKEIGASEKAVIEAFREVPAMSREQFEQIAKILFILANQLSTSAYQNVQQARFITDRKQAEEQKAELEAQNRHLQKSESLGRMAGAIAHHFNNQFHVVMGNLEMAMNDLPIGLNPIEKLLLAMQSVRKAAEVSNLMLTYLGQSSGKHEPMDLSEFCCNSMPLLQATAPKGLIFKADFPASGPVVRADAGQVQHILTNLIANAWESSDENQRDISLTVKTVIKEDILALNRFPVDWQPQESAYACIEVSDKGCGISEENFEKIFDPFFSTKFTGRGLGLSVVLGIVRAHHGAVTVESKLDRGSTFRLFFPVSAEEVPKLTHNAVQPLKTEEGGTVLLVEDEENMRNMVKTMLIHLGFTVLEARDGPEAVEVFRQHQREIRCVICELSMPRMDGWETLTALRKLSPDIPVILSSGYSKELIMASEHPERPNAFLSKPYQLKELSDTIHRVAYASDWHG